jgi:hypothetical protein
MYIKEDLIIPHHYSFYDLIVTKARGKSGPLFHFDVHDDVRMTIDANLEKVSIATRTLTATPMAHSARTLLLCSALAVPLSFLLFFNRMR